MWIDGIGYPADVVRTFAHRDLAVVDALVPSAARVHLAAASLASRIGADDRIVIWDEDDADPRLERGRIVATAFVDPLDAEAPPLVAVDCERCGRGDSGGASSRPMGRSSESSSLAIGESIDASSQRSANT